ncbi:sensor histidine kinase [Pseudonocardia sp. GCM10023141]|uniref:sensor histidine kinase n=1 Tax=Pseudonocardia sp. GCM10023141 TaxID=3252653 RepID=UPI0036230888
MGAVIAVADTHTGADAGLPRRARTLAVAACVVVLLPTVLLGSDVSLWGRLVAAALVVVQAAAMWLMGSSPGRAVAVVIVAGAGIQLLAPAVGFGIAFVALCTLAWLRPPRTSLWALAGTLVLAALDGLVARPWTEAMLWAAGAVLAWTWGQLGRLSAARRRAETRRAILEERARISRELHDVLAHTVSVMVVQAGAADDVFDVSPDRAREAVRAIETTGRQAQAELRQLLRTVRPDAGAEQAPQPGLAELAALGRSVAAAGLDVRMQVDAGSGDPIPAGIQLSAYRIVQESLTNALRHAHAARAEVAVRVVRTADGHHMLVGVHDDGRGGSGRAGSGQGLLGMRERAELLGGTFEAGPDPAGGFRVSALLPVPR